MPKIPASHVDSERSEVVDLRDRKACTLCDGKVVVTFPVGEKEACEQFELLRRRAGEWKEWVARGIRDKETGVVRPMPMGTMKLPFVVKPRVGEDGEELQPLYIFTYLSFHKKKGTSKTGLDRNWSYVPWASLAPPVLDFYSTTFAASLNHFICKLYRSASELNPGKAVASSASGGRGGGGGGGADVSETKNNVETKKNDAKKKEAKKAKKADGIDWHQVIVFVCLFVWRGGLKPVGAHVSCTG